MLVGVVPEEVLRSTEWQARMRSSNGLLRNTQKPVFEAGTRAVAVVDVARAWAGKPMRITSVAAAKAPTSFTLGERTYGKIVCFETVAAACRAPQQHSGKLPRGTTRQLLLLEVGVLGNGSVGVTRGTNGMITCNTAMAVSLAPLPAGAIGAKALPLPPFWLPAGGTEDPSLPEAVPETVPTSATAVALAEAPAEAPAEPPAALPPAAAAASAEAEVVAFAPAADLPVAEAPTAAEVYVVDAPAEEVYVVDAA